MTARDIRTVTVEKAGKLDGKPAPAATTAPLPGVELTHRTEEEKEVQMPLVQPVEKDRKAEQSQPVTARDIRTVTAETANRAVSEPVPAAMAPLSGVELTHRAEEEKEVQTPPVRPVEKGKKAEQSQPVTVRDIRTVTAEKVSPAASESAPATTAHLPGVELTHRTEEEQEAQTPPVQPMKKYQTAEHSQPVTARDIRTVTTEQSGPAAGELAPASATAPLPGVELAHRTEEEKEVQAPPVQPVEKGRTAEHSQPVTARDIRTATAEKTSPMASEPAPAVKTVPLPGVELTHRTEEEKESQIPPAQPMEKGRKAEHIHRFEENCPDWAVEEITVENLAECAEMDLEWNRLYRQERENGAETTQSRMDERHAMSKAFAHYDALGLTGLLLRTGGRVVAFTMGSPIGADTFDIHFEKAYGEIQGAYAMINRAFARWIRDHYPQVCYLNREDDMGLEGLRKAKESYYPDCMVEKYTLVRPMS